MPKTLIAAVLVLAAGLASPVFAVDVVLTTDNDFLTHNPTKDDLYTFGFSVAFTHGPYRITLRQNAFTDREAGARFDESRITVARTVPRLRTWTLDLEGGIVHVGQGLLDQDFQNWFHRQIGSDQLDLAYVDASVHALAALRAERSFRPAPSFAIGPRFEVETAPGFQSHAVIGAQARWRPIRGFAVEGLGGGRFSHASLAVLEPHIVPAAPIARVSVVLHDAVALSWTYNDYGDRRQHVSLGVAVGPDGWGMPRPPRSEGTAGEARRRLAQALRSAFKG